MIDITIHGKAIPQGSKRSMTFQRGGKTMSRVINDNPNLSDWRQQIASVAAEAMQGQEVAAGSVSLVVTFFRQRPKSHYGTGRNAGKLKASAPLLPTTRPDSLKLARAVEDALTGIVYRDDSQICDHLIYKRWSESDRVHVSVTT